VTRRTATLLVLLFGILAAALLTRRGEVAWMALPALGLLAAGLAGAPDARALRLGAERTVERPAGGGVEVRVRVRNEGTAPVHLRLWDGPSPAVATSSGSTSLRTLLRPGEVAVLEYAFRVPRGRFTWRSVAAVASDPLRLVEAALELPAPAELHVHPELKRFHPLPLQPRRTLPSPGSIPARTGGSGTEFWGVREYQLGDPLRRLDWRLAARHPGQLFTREFEQEQLADVGLVLDVRTPAPPRPGEAGLLEHAVGAAASLAEVFLRQGHRVSLLVLGEPEVRVFPGFGRVQLQKILGCLAGARALHGPASAPLGGGIGRLFPARSLLVVLSPLAAADPGMLHRLKGHGRQVVLVSPDPIDFHARPQPRDGLGLLALRAARIERQLGLRAIAQLRVPVVDWRVDEPLYPLVRNALRPARGQRIA
jgi:uncharacterized protein (DUF58 family)